MVKSELFLQKLASFPIFPIFPSFPGFPPKYEYDFGFESNFQIVAICSFFIAQ